MSTPGICPDELQRQRNEQPQFALPPSPAAYAAAHADTCTHRRTYTVAGRVFCSACGRKVGMDEVIEETAAYRDEWTNGPMAGFEKKA